MTTANSSGLQVRAERRRKSEHTVTIGEADGDDVVVSAGDNVRFKIGRGAGTPLLEIQSDAATSNGSICTAANPTTLTLGAGDLTFPAGIYDIEAVIIDDSESNAPKKAETGIFILEESAGGVLT